jgi:AraC-like DNA-binding protein
MFGFVTPQMRSPHIRRTQSPVPEADRVPPGNTARIGTAQHLPVVLRERGVDVREALADSGLRADLFESPDNPITMPEFARLLEACEQRTRCGHIWLLAAKRSGLAELGLPGQIARVGATVGEGLGRFVDHFNLHSTVSIVSLSTSGPFSRFVFAVSGPTTVHHFIAGALIIAFNILRDLCGPTWRPTVVPFATRAPSDGLNLLERHIRAPLRFDSDESALVFASSWLDRPLPPVDPLFRQRVEAMVRARHAAIVADFPSTVRRLLRKQLMAGRQNSMQEMAALLGMHRRTLDRLLQRQGVSYGGLVEALNNDMARQLLRETDLQVQEVAASLLYSSAANFATAFRRWTDMTPSEFRRSVL